MAMACAMQLSAMACGMQQMARRHEWTLVYPGLAI